MSGVVELFYMPCLQYFPSTYFQFLTLVQGKLPFDDDDIRKLLGKVKSGVFTMPAFLPKEAQDLISRMLTVDPSKRITITQIKEHPWFLSNSPEPGAFLPPVSVEDMVNIPKPVSKQSN